ncbi:MAG: TraR/DksA family transcriptional regulator [Propionibacteriaceae bacterium]|nr:TraR/DksA family transcriptional regulator [Propionibacteriaceae bacterium]
MAANESGSVPPLPVLPGEEPWTPEETAELRSALEDNIARMRRAIAEAEDDLADRMNEGPDGAGKDPADVGSANFERDQEMSLAANTREMLNQAELALALFDQGRYGYCEACGKPIGKLRLQAFPRATLCVACKLKEERR